jgi:hypothetical protein
MKGLTVALLDRACRIFLQLAYPGGEHTIPPPRRDFLRLAPDQPLERVLVPPLCQALPAPGGGSRGYALRLGSANHPHLKLQAVRHDDTTWLFAVDTHDAIPLEPDHPDAARWAQLRTANRRLKEQIERAWEAAGLLTFNGLLRQELGRR